MQKIVENPKALRCFLVVLPGFEEQAFTELNHWAPNTEAKTVKGGVEFSANYATLARLIRALKIPTRILLRAYSFEATTYTELRLKLTDFNWAPWLRYDDPIQVVVTSYRSKLFHRQRVGEAVKGALVKVAQGLKATDAEKQKIRVVVRIENNRVDVSLDMGGETLHKRGNLPKVVRGSLRETIAAGLIYRMMSWQKKISEAKVSIKLIDPMAGSGVFANEAMNLFALNHGRSFLLDRIYQPKKGENQAAADSAELQISEVILFEKSEKAFAVLEDRFGQYDGPVDISLFHQDFFDSETLDTSDQKPNSACWAFINPPYGEKLKIAGGKRAFYESILLQLQETAAPTLVAMIVPASARPAQLHLPDGWQLLESLPFSNGGIPVTALFFTAKGTD